MPNFSRDTDYTRELDRDDDELYEQSDTDSEGSSLFEEIDQRLAPHA
jgi:hypothetical protein